MYAIKQLYFGSTWWALSIWCAIMSVSCLVVWSDDVFKLLWVGPNYLSGCIAQLFLYLLFCLLVSRCVVRLFCCFSFSSLNILLKLCSFVFLHVWACLRLYLLVCLLVCLSKCYIRYVDLRAHVHTMLFLETVCGHKSFLRKYRFSNSWKRCTVTCINTSPYNVFMN